MDNKVKFSVQEDTRKYPGQQCQDDLINQKFRTLHRQIVNAIIQFCKENDILIDEFHLSADDLEGSIKFGSWQACTDSCLRFDKFTQEYKDCVSMKDKASIKKFADDKEYHRICNEQESFLFSM